MNRLTYALLLSAMALIGQLFASTPESLTSESLYQKHLPVDIFEYIVKNNLVDIMRSETITKKQSVGSFDHLTISLDEHEGEDFVNIDFHTESPNNKANFSGIQLGFQSGKLMGYAIFDAIGRDYVAFAPFSEEDEKQVITFILLLMEGGLAKVIEEEQDKS